MNREQFEHTIRAAAAIVGESEVIVIGSQAVHAWIGNEIPAAAKRSVEADIALREDVDGSKADLIDGSIGEASLFQETFGIYAHGVSVETAILPPGWEDRLVRFATPATAGVLAWCLSPEDLWVAKALAGRTKDLELCQALLDEDTVQTDRLADLIDGADANAAKKRAAQELLDEGHRLSS